MIDKDDDQKNAPPPINRFSGTISFSRRKMQSRNLEQVHKMSTDKRPKRPKKRKMNGIEFGKRTSQRQMNILIK